MNDSYNSNSIPNIKQVIILIVALFCCAVFFIAISAMEDASISNVSNIKISDAPVTTIITEPQMGEYILFENCQAYIEGQDIESWDVKLVLKPQASDEGIVFPTYLSSSIRHVGAYSLPVENKRINFGATVHSKKLSLDTVNYDIILYYNNNEMDMYIDTGKDLTKEGLR